MAKSTKSPSAGVTYLVTQESFDAAFHAGRAVAGAFQSAALALAPMLSPLSAREDEHCVRQWNEYRRAFSLGMAAERQIDPDSARRMFGRIVDFLALNKPQSPAARIKAAARAKAKPSAPVGSMEDAATPKDGAGAAAAATVKMVLSEFEARVIGFLRAGKAEMAAEAIAAHAEV